jgi:tetratricopeptide (TPR) repeat protein
MASYVPRLIREHSRATAVALGLLVLAGTGAGLYAYALRQWDAAGLAIKEDRPDEARKRLRVCLFLWPRSVPVHLLAARAARLSEDLPEAEAHLNRCLRLQGGATEAVQLEFLLLRVQAGEADEVAPALVEVIENKHPETPLILETLARHYMHHLRYHQAYAYLTRWIEDAPETPKPYRWRGWVYERLNKSKPAMDDYLRALELDPEIVEVRLRVAEMLLEDNNPQEALPHLERLIARFPDRPDIMARLGQCRFLQGDSAGARRLLEQAEKKLPDDAPLLIHLAKLDLQEGHLARAENLSYRVLKVDPTDTEARYTLVAVLRLQGRSREADAELERFQEYKSLVQQTNRLLKQEAESPSGDAATASEIGRLLLRTGRDQLALYWLDQALQRDPAYEPAHRALADYYDARGEHDKAAPHRRRLRNRRPGEEVGGRAEHPAPPVAHPGPGAP